MLNLDLLVKHQMHYDHTIETRYYEVLNPIYVRDTELCPTDMIKIESGNVVKNFRCVNNDPISICH